jgi:hypothetical protein
VQQRAVAGRHPGAVLQVLHPERHTGERPELLPPSLGHGPVDALRGSTRSVGVEVHERVQLRVAGIDARQAGLDQVERAAAPRPDVLGGLDDGRQVVGVGHGP